MNTSKWGAILGIGALAFGILTAPAHAAGRARWSGDVDDRAEIHIRGSRVWVTQANAKGVQNVRSNVSRPLPTRRERVTLVRQEGRGRVELIEQPRPNNNYTAVVRITDSQSGRGHYAFAVRW